MKNYHYISLIILLSACNSKLPEKTNESISADSSVIKVKGQQVDTANIKRDTISINNVKYIQTSIKSNFNCLLSLQGDSIIKSEDYYHEAEIIDINEDGYQDIRVFVFSNTPNQCDNYLFKASNKKFKLIENCYLDIHKIKGTAFYFSYNRAGCADMNWESNLSKIENDTLVNYGYINGQGCESEDANNPQIIEIYKVINSVTDEKKLIKTLPYQKHINELVDKWDFIENYWSKNYRKFEK